MGIFSNDPKFQKLDAVRKSGYKGPIDQNGNKAKVVGKGLNARIKKK